MGRPWMKGFSRLVSLKAWCQVRGRKSKIPRSLLCLKVGKRKYIGKAKNIGKAKKDSRFHEG
jgi:hypothetical protein